VSDTGAPWNLPYPLPTDLVRDGADAIKDLAEATATGLSAAGNAGIGSNVVQSVKVNQFTTTSTVLTDISDLDVTITPTSDTAKVLILLDIAFGHTASVGSTSSAFQLVRGTTNVPVSSVSGRMFNPLAAGTNIIQYATLAFLDSPGVDTATTYKIRASTASGTLTVNRRGADASGGSVSAITAIEVEA
jgi:hypothetical protein